MAEEEDHLRQRSRPLHVHGVEHHSREGQQIEFPPHQAGENTFVRLVSGGLFICHVTRIEKPPLPGWGGFRARTSPPPEVSVCGRA
ncbi:hypothetical protein Psi01_77520 [Planobispora siamensis]|uniref:Uncharacterized protein n=1 Tax=Planobispora siamensis TaxID=936338 RepID=A0A8J3SQM9_9ACTN|nr:hypothetical protein Psi01_77520 [Planobispora siamensis]